MRSSVVWFSTGSTLVRRLVARALFIALTVTTITACGDGIFRTGSTDVPVQGAGVKGALVDSLVVAYRLDPSRADLKGEQVASGFSDSNAALQMRINSSEIVDGTFLIEYLGGTEIMGQAPVIDRLQTLITSEQLRNREPVYATPLSSLALHLASNALSVGDANSFDEARATAEQTVLSAFGLADRQEINLFLSSPILSNSQTAESTFVLRRANEIFAAAVESISEELSSDGLPQTGASIVALLAADLGDGGIDGQSHSATITELSSVNDLQASLVNAASRNVPGTSAPFTQLDSVLIAEASAMTREVGVGAVEMLAVAAASPSNLVSFNPEFGDGTGDGDQGGNTDGGNTDGGNTDGGNTDGGNTDGGNTDGGNTDGGNTDGGNTDGGNTDGGNTDGGNTDGGNTDGGNTDGGNTDGGNTDGGNTDGGNTDGGNTDGGNTDGGNTDGGNTDGGNTDGGNTDGGNTDGGNTDGGNTDGGNTDGGAVAVEVSWVWPTVREDGSALQASDVDSFEIFLYEVGRAAAGTNVSLAASNSGELVNSYLIADLEQGDYEFAVATIDTNGNVGAFTDPVGFSIQ